MGKAWVKVTCNERKGRRSKAPSVGLMDKGAAMTVVSTCRLPAALT